nr:MAG TPA: hypothetical protein [Caudoviricetes sp.]
MYRIFLTLYITLFTQHRILVNCMYLILCMLIRMLNILTEY